MEWSNLISIYAHTDTEAEAILNESTDASLSLSDESSLHWYIRLLFSKEIYPEVFTFALPPYYY
jgi:hypothetical protein